MNFCLKCALIAGSLLALGASPTPRDVQQAKTELCQAAGYGRENKDELFDAAFSVLDTDFGGDHARAQGAMGRALFEYMEGDWQNCANPDAAKRLQYLMHDEHENEMGAGS